MKLHLCHPLEVRTIEEIECFSCLFSNPPEEYKITITNFYTFMGDTVNDDSIGLCCRLDALCMNDAICVT